MYTKIIHFFSYRLNLKNNQDSNTFKLTYLTGNLKEVNKILKLIVF